MARFRYDGSDFDITSQGPCNIWGLVLTGEGEAWIQEANDYGYPVMPFHEYANYPGCSNRQWKSYAPEFPGTAPDAPSVIRIERGAFFVLNDSLNFFRCALFAI